MAASCYIASHGRIIAWPHHVTAAGCLDREERREDREERGSSKQPEERGRRGEREERREGGEERRRREPRVPLPPHTSPPAALVTEEIEVGSAREIEVGGAI